MYDAAASEWITAKANELGFDLCGIASAEGLADPADLKEWLARGYAGQMRYMHDPRRAEIKQVLPDARAIIVCALNYNTANPSSIEAAAQASIETAVSLLSKLPLRPAMGRRTAGFRDMPGATTITL